MSTTSTYSVCLITECVFTGTVKAVSVEAAIEEAYRIWHQECPHPFEQSDDACLRTITAEEVQP